MLKHLIVKHQLFIADSILLGKVYKDLREQLDAGLLEIPSETTT